MILRSNGPILWCGGNLPDQKGGKNDFWAERSNKIDSFGIIYERELKLPDEAVLREPEEPEKNPVKTKIKQKSLAQAVAEKTKEKKERIRQITKKQIKRLNPKSLVFFLISPIRSHKKRLVTILLAFLLVFGSIQAVKAKNELAINASEAREHINKSFEYIDKGNVERAVTEAQKAKKNIRKLKLLTQIWGQDIKYFGFVPSKPSKLAAYERFLDSAYGILDSISMLNGEIKSAFKNKAMASGNNIPSLDLVAFSETISKGLDKTERDLAKSKADLLAASQALPEDLQSSCEEAIKIVDKAQDSIQTTRYFLDNGFPWLAGKDGGDKKILIIFQNNAELRGGSGGSLGSFGIAQFSRGKFEKIDFGTNIYKLDNPIKNSVNDFPAPPEVLKPIVGDKWVLKDSGWAVDGREALSNIATYYEKETGTSVDGVITIDTTAFGALLGVTGPIDLPQYDATITQDNFRNILENETHNDYFNRPGALAENEPKKMISEMMPIFFNNFYLGLEDQDKSIALAETLKSSLLSKNILLYFKNDDLQSFTDSLNWSGQVPNTIGDFLYLNNSNLNGFKSSLSVDEKLRFSTISDSLNLSRNHFGNDTLPDGLNRNYIRMLIPQGSKVESFSPVLGNFNPYFDQPVVNSQYYSISEEANKSSVNFWMNTKPKEQSEVTIGYKPNYRVDTYGDFNYQIYFAKQPGSLTDEIELTLNYPAGYEPTNVKNYDFINRLIVIKKSLKTDEEIVVKFTKQKK
jgi:hypothetical protein